MMPRRALRSLLIPIAAACAALAFAVDWPTSNSPVLLGFGQNDAGRASVGMTFSAQGTVRAADAGEILFKSSQGAEGVGGFPQTFGDWLAVDHGGGIVGVYARMTGIDAEARSAIVEKNAVLGSAGTTGWSPEEGYFFSLHDKSERRWVNPTMISISRPDAKAPQIRSVVLVSREGQSYPLASTRFLRQGAYRVIIEAYDIEDQSPGKLLAPQRLSFMVNGAEQGALHLETIKAENGALTVWAQSPVSADKVYLKSGAYEIGEAKLTRGRASLEAIARDAAGNERAAAFALQVE